MMKLLKYSIGGVVCSAALLLLPGWVGAQTPPSKPVGAGAAAKPAVATGASSRTSPAQVSLPPLSSLRLAAGAGESTLEGAVLSVAALIEQARRESPAVAQALAELAFQRAGVGVAMAIPNPEVELQQGRTQARQAQGLDGSSPLWGVAQSLEWPALRGARREVAERRVQTAQVQLNLTDRELVAAIRRACAELLRLEEEELTAAEDLALTEQIRSRIGMSTRAGEVPRFDLTRAEGEVAIARKVLETTRLRRGQARFDLRRVLGWELPEPFRIDPTDAAPPRIAVVDFERLLSALEATNPELAIAQSELARSRQEIAFEKAQVWPKVVLRATHEADSVASLTRFGAQVVLPIFDQRAGAIAQAVANAERSRAALALRRMEVLNGFESAWRAWLAAEAQLRALDAGIVSRAREILGTAEAAYRYGERGILETLDAQRQFRAVRNELIAARYAVALTRIELERLTGL